MTTCEPLATVTDLFCGGGGASEGMRQAGLEIVQAADMWAPALATHAENHPSARHLSGDITTYHPKAMDTTDMLWASPPCVQFSVARGAYDDSPEADQVRDMVHVITPLAQHHRYRAIVVENVTQAFSSRHYEAWLRDMDHLGYDSTVLTLNSAVATDSRFLPVAQTRERGFAILWRRGTLSREKLAHHLTRGWGYCTACGVGTYGRRHQKTRRALGRLWASYIYVCEECESQAWAPGLTPLSSVLAPVDGPTSTTQPLTARQKTFLDGALARYSALARAAEQYGSEAQDWGDPTLRMPSQRLHLAYPGRQSLASYLLGHAAEGSEGLLELLVSPQYTQSGACGHRSVTPVQQAHTLTTQHSWRLVQMADPASQWSLDRVTHRALSVTEVAEIQGFPAGYRLPDKLTTATKILGNSVPPPLSQQIAYWLNYSLRDRS